MLRIVAQNSTKSCIGSAFRFHLRPLTNQLGGRLDYGQPACSSSEMDYTRAKCATQSTAKRLQRKRLTHPGLPAQDASAFTHRNGLRWNPPKHYSVVKV